MLRFALIIALLLSLPSGRAEPLAGAAQSHAARAERGWQRSENRPPLSHEQLAERFQHREARIREALSRGDLTPAEADTLRQRMEMRRQRLERLRDRQRDQPDRATDNLSPAAGN